MNSGVLLSATWVCVSTLNGLSVPKLSFPYLATEASNILLEKNVARFLGSFSLQITYPSQVSQTQASQCLFPLATLKKNHASVLPPAAMARTMVPSDFTWTG